MKCSIKGCPGVYENKEILHTVRHRGQVLGIEDVPAEVCSVCGDVLFSPQTVRHIEMLLESTSLAGNVDAEILSEAARHDLWELDRQKISEESQIYRQIHSDLKTKYLGQYVAMHDGSVVDHDSDLQTLYKRIRQRYGRTPVMITLVEEEPVRTLIRRGFRLERTNQ